MRTRGSLGAKQTGSGFLPRPRKSAFIAISSCSVLTGHMVPVYIKHQNNHPSNLHVILPAQQCLSQDLETGCLKLAVVKFWGVQFF